jgi:PAS domain S-box-containing protein
MSKDSLQTHEEHTLAEPVAAQAFEKLAETICRSQHNYRELIDNIDQALFTISLQGEIRVANLHMAQILGASFQEIIGHKLSDFIESPQWADAQSALPAFLRQGLWTGTLPVRLKKSDELRYFTCSLQTVVEKGEVGSLTGWAQDITAQYDTQIRFAELFESLSAGIIFASPEGRILDANPALVRMLGYSSKEEMQKLNFRDMYADPSARDAVVRQLAVKGSIHDQEIVLRRMDGKRIHCLTSGFAICDTSGRLIRLQGTVVDITERKEAEKRLRQEQGFVARLIANFPDLIAVVNREGRFTYMSNQVQNVLGWPPDGYPGDFFADRASADDKTRLHDVFRRVISGQQARVEFEFRAQHADGRWRILLATASPLYDEDGAISGMVTSARDVTEAKRAEQQLAQNEKYTAIGQMMTGAAHELNNPLTAILGVSDLLRERATDDATRRQINLILQQARRAAAIVQNLLAFSRPASQLRVKISPAAIVQEALQSEKAALSQKNITVKFTSPDDLPAVEGDRKLLTQVFLNIIANAEQSISPARDHGTLEVSLSRDGSNVRVTFADDGPGISPENMGKIFDPFFTTKRPGGGSGLGLTICLAVVKEHGGTIEVQSRPDAGATVHVLLPIFAEALSAAPIPQSSASPTASVALDGHTVLIVDDEESIREIVQDTLSARGMKVHAAGSSEEALSYLAANACEIVLCDFNLPGMNGDQFFEQVRAQQGDAAPRFVFMTGEFVDPSVVARYQEKGARVLQKPFHISALSTFLAELLQTQPSRSD